MKTKIESCFDTFPKKKNVLKFLDEVRYFLFPGYFEKLNGSEERYLERKLERISLLYTKYVCADTANEFIKELKELLFCIPSSPNMRSAGIE